ncbi:hypothetical protein [Myxococcus sp. RHSTA-1-4]|uniref:hypothetical protein n=1 Tax=Myxococcus sp. RHSTA-1-4 TaxID=2874601 RepID=UPI001CBC1A2C|nr:hypothetical protein [Myxococcus sp. RHSTA-1-4]MBZ4415902.1 hypothetical protein [Myxococcus sp. RHSTA-1-4]
MSSPDLSVFPMVKSGDGLWMMVAYAATPGGKLVRDSRGELIPAEHWLATGHRDEPRFYKWNHEGALFKWNEDRRRWDFQATCRPRTSMLDTGVLPAQCVPALN